MTEEWDPFEAELLEWLLGGPHGVPRKTVDATVTGLLLLVHPTERIRKSLRRASSRRRWALDRHLLRRLLEAAPREVRLRALFAEATRELPEQVFEHLYRPAVTGRLKRAERLLASIALLGRLNRWPAETGLYALDVQRFLHDTDQEVALQALPSAAKLPAPDSADIDAIARLLVPAKTRLSALSALNAILGRGAYPRSALPDSFWKKVERLAKASDPWISSGAARLLSLRITRPSARRSVSTG